MYGIVALVLWIILIAPVMSFAQDQTSGVSAVKKIQELFQERDPLAETLKQAGALKADFESSQSGADRETATRLRVLKNPFTPKLPVIKPPEPGKSQVIAKPGGPTEEAVPAPPMTVAGLIWDTDRPQAILNGHIVGVGDIVDSWTIVKISQNGVEISLEGRNFLIGPPEVRDTPNTSKYP